MIFGNLAFDLQENEVKVEDVDVGIVLTETQHDLVQHHHELLGRECLTDGQPREVSSQGSVDAGHDVLEVDQGGPQIDQSRNRLMESSDILDPPHLSSETMSDVWLPREKVTRSPSPLTSTPSIWRADTGSDTEQRVGQILEQSKRDLLTNLSVSTSAVL